MKPEIVNLWAEALESGEYTQISDGYLHTNKGFCAYGVLCDLAVKAGAINEPQFLEGTMGFDCYRYDGNACHPPDAVFEWAGRGNMIKVIHMNDSGKSFKAIASYVRKNP